MTAHSRKESVARSDAGRRQHTGFLTRWFAALITLPKGSELNSEVESETVPGWRV